MKTSLSDEILHRLQTHYNYTERVKDPFRVLISTILSQRTRDENTAKASQALFHKFDTAEELAKAPVEEVEPLIKPAGFYRVKAQRIVKAAQHIVKKYQGEVPDTLEELLHLEGVGRKTANCVLVYGFGTPAIPVDVHVHRIANRLCLVDTKTPKETEKELMKIFDRKKWLPLNQLLVMFGKDVCTSRNPQCAQCFLSDLCVTHQERG